VNILCIAFLSAIPVVGQTRIHLPELLAPGTAGERFELSSRGGETRIYGRGSQVPRVYFGEFLPALFRRTISLENPIPAGSTVEWIFTGDQGGITLQIGPQSVRVLQRYYDSLAHAESNPPKVRFPAKTWDQREVAFTGTLRSVTVTLDHKLGLEVELNGQPALRQVCLLEVRRHQLRLVPPAPGMDIRVSGSLGQPETVELAVHVDAGRKAQTVYGFGGILSAPGYAILSAAGKQKWWNLLKEYNLLIDRQYPNGNRLRTDLSNFGDLALATPHGYGDNFPNGEITDFDYLRRFRSMGGHVWFEFWELPPWARRPIPDARGKTGQSAAVVDEYVRAMVGFCRILREKTGSAPEVLGIQNELPQPPEVWRDMIVALRQELDAAGFRSVRLHMPDHGNLQGGIRTADTLRAYPQAWKALDYSASHLYDFQDFFENPDGYDERIAAWNRTTGGKPFLSTELTVNYNRYQTNSYRVAFAQAQLYHKNLALMNASALLYCWTLLDVEQPSFAATRSLFGIDRANGFVPVPSSYQLRTYGAFSRRLRKGMVRVDARTSSPGLLSTAYEGPDGSRTVIAINRSTSPVAIRIDWPGAAFAEWEVAGPYNPNTIRKYAQQKVHLEPGEIATLTNVALGGPASIP